MCWRHQRKVQETHKDLRKATRELRRTSEEKDNTITDKDRTIAELKNIIKNRENQCAVWYKEERKTQERNKELKIQLKAEKEANLQKTSHIEKLVNETKSTEKTLRTQLEETKSTEKNLRRELYNRKIQTGPPGTSLNTSIPPQTITEDLIQRCAEEKKT